MGSFPEPKLIGFFNPFESWSPCPLRFCIIIDIISVTEFVKIIMPASVYHWYLGIL